jgi:hypothetical protein
MGTDKEDTDPSSPSALRPNSQPGLGAAVAHVLPDPPGGQPTTDPGLGPPSAAAPASARRPMAVTVPAPSVRPRPGPSAITPPELTPIAAPVSMTPSPTKDSVELLLEGMAGPRPDRRKTTPQSDGEASAAYHAEHRVRRARTSEPAGPKVVVERPATPQERVTPPERAALHGAVRGPRGSGESREALSTFVPARVLRRRVAMAIVAGILIVLLSFMALRLTRQGDSAGPAAPTATVAPTEPDPPVAPSAAAPSPEPTTPTMQASAAAPEPALPVPSTQAAETHADDSRPAAPTRPAGATTRHHRTPGDAPAAQGDLGEFKAKF